MSWMRVVAKVLLWVVAGMAALVALGAALFYYFVYTPAPEPPQLSGTLTRNAFEFDGLRRSYSIYLPQALPPNPPLVFALHGSDGSATRMRIETGYAFERLADQHGFVLVYPNGFEGNWNGCNIVGEYSANARDIDDVGFLSALVDRLVTDVDADPHRVFAIGVSRGGHMAFRLALEAPSRFRAIAAVAANLPAADNFKCHPNEESGTSVMIMNGVRDPMNPFEGGEVRLLGLYNRGSVLSAHASAQYFARLNSLADAPTISSSANIERRVWRDGAVEIELAAIQQGGHSLPQSYRRAPRILGPTAQFDGPNEIWTFFERQSH